MACKRSCGLRTDRYNGRDFSIIHIDYTCMNVSIFCYPITVCMLHTE